MFWVHLTCGLAVGSVVLLMSVTGVLLTYEKQLEEWSDRRYWTAPASEGPRAPLSAIVSEARAVDPKAPVSSVTLYADVDAPAAVAFRGGSTVYLDPSTGTVRGEANPKVRAFFSSVTGWHRWFNLTGDTRVGARAITGWSNLIFLFLVLSGLYLWVPRKWRWQHLKPALFFNTAARGKARDFNWHHVFGFWAASPLAIVVASATVISFPWASDLAYRVMGDEPPRRGARAPTAPSAPAAPSAPVALAAAPPPVTPPSPGANELAMLPPGEEEEGGPRPFDVRALDRLVAPATERVPGWRTITFAIPDEPGAPVQVRIDEGWGGQPQLRHTLSYDAGSGSETGYSGFTDQSRGQRLRTLLRFTHTGEVYGLIGQTLAGVASLAGAFLVWTGFALAWRRLVSPLLRSGGGEAPS